MCMTSGVQSPIDHIKDLTKVIQGICMPAALTSQHIQLWQTDRLSARWRDGQTTKVISLHVSLLKQVKTRASTSLDGCSALKGEKGNTCLLSHALIAMDCIGSNYYTL